MAQGFAGALGTRGRPYPHPVDKPARSKSIIFRKAKLADIFEALFAFWHSMRFS